jgi:alanyl-tRNA synthetase
LVKLDKTAEKLVKELKEANVEKRRLVKELAAKESSGFEATEASEAPQDINGVKLVKRDFKQEIDANRMVQTASKITEQNQAAVALFFGTEGKTARILVMAGKVAVEKGVNASEVIREVSPIIGGGGGGRPTFAQGGGTNPEKLQDAVKAAEETIKKQLKR